MGNDNSKKSNCIKVIIKISVGTALSFNISLEEEDSEKYLISKK